MKGISIDWFYNPPVVHDVIFDKIVESLFGNGKITKYSYNIIKKQENPSNAESFWVETLNINDDIDWSEIHNNNFSCTIETQLRAFYFKMFHRAICTNKFLHKIGRIDSALCSLCKKYDESLVHLFCECDEVINLWDNLYLFIESKTGDFVAFSNFQKLFGVTSSDFVHKNAFNFLILCFKFYIHRCKFQQISPNFQAFMSFVRLKFNTEYKIAEGKGKLGNHFKKFSFDLSED